jgi:hypothetical protein
MAIEKVALRGLAQKFREPEYQSLRFFQIFVVIGLAKR